MATNPLSPIPESAPVLTTDQDLLRVSGGAFPTSVNDQITDSVT
ncbi:MAG TPA: hypothetical protein PKM88_12415 [bacterium]|nr:hypothetical protein [bacterium]